MIVLLLPWPPGVNAMWRSINGRSILSKAGREYREAGLTALLTQRRPILPLQSRLGVTLTVWAPDRRRRDLDNIPKGVLDLLTHAGVYVDDSQIDRLLIVRGPVQKGGGVCVELEVLA